MDTRQKGGPAVDHIEHLNRYTLRQRDGLPKLGTDSVLLSRFATVHRGNRVLDLGCGVGVLGVLLGERCDGLTLDGVEIVAQAAELAAQNLRENGLRGEILCQDLRRPGWFLKGHYDLIVSNPPYFPAGAGAMAKGALAGARSELTCTLEELCQAAAPRLKTGGRFAIVCRTQRLTDLMVALRRNDLEPKRLQMIQYNPQKPPKLFLLEAIRQGRPGLRVEAAGFLASDRTEP